MNRLHSRATTPSLAVLGLALLCACTSTGVGASSTNAPDSDLEPRTEPVSADASEAVEAGALAPAGTPAGPPAASLALPTGDAETSTLLLEKFAPQQVTAKGPFEYRIVVTNLTPLYLENVVVTESLPSGLTLQASDPAASGSRLGGLEWNLGTIEPRSARTISVEGSAAEEGSFSTCSRVSWDTGACMAIEVTQPSLAITATGTTRATPCDPIEYTYVVTNTGSGTARNVVLRGDLPTDLETEGSTRVAQVIGDLPAGESREIVLPVAAGRTGTFTHVLTAAADGGLEATTEALTTVVRQPVLEITQTAPQSAFIGRNTTFEIRVTNTGDEVAANTVLTSALPSGATLVGQSEGGVAKKDLVVWQLGDLEPAGSRTVTLKLKSEDAAVLRASASVEADCASPARAEARTEFVGIPAVLLEVVDLEDPVEVGSEVTYLVKVTNQGSAAGKNVAVTCTLPPNVTYVSGTGATKSTLSGSRLVLAPIASLAPGKDAEWRITVRGSAPADARFKVQMKTDDMKGEPVLETESTNFYQ